MRTNIRHDAELRAGNGVVLEWAEVGECDWANGPALFYGEPGATWWFWMFRAFIRGIEEHHLPGPYEISYSSRATAQPVWQEEKHWPATRYHEAKQFLAARYGQVWPEEAWRELRDMMNNGGA